MRRSGRRLAAAPAAALVALAAGVGSVGPASPSDGSSLATPAPPRGAELRALGRPGPPAPLASQRVYFVMTDRYANGSPANDTGGADGPRSVTGYDPTDPGFFHGGDFAGLTGDCTGPRGLARIRDLGFTAIWVTPPYRQKYVQGDSAGYHGYWSLGFDEVDPHLGTAAEFGAFVECAHRLGLKVILDVVVNHTADVIQLPSYEYGPPKAPFVPPAERLAKSPAWLNDPANYHNRGNIDFNSCSQACFELGDFFGLDDLATEQTDVREGLARVFADWVRRYRVDGFRIDTARHVERGFFGAWVPRISAAAREAGVRDFQLFGEAFLTDAIELSEYVRERGLPNVLDFPLQDALVRFAGGSAGAAGIASRLADDDYFAGADGVAHVPPTFLGNHDIGRAAQQVRDKGLGRDALLQRTLLAHDLLYLLRGAPVAYYGDEFGILGTGGDRAARHDLFATAVPEWREQERIGADPIGARSYFDEAAHPVAERLRTLGTLRATHPVLATGASYVRAATRSALAVSRIDAAERREYLALVNAGRSPARVTFATATPRSGWTPLFGSVSASTSSARGRVTVTIPPLSSALLRATRPLPPRRATRPSVRVGRDPLSELVRVSATVGGEPTTVAFAIRRTGSARWARVAVDASPPYRAFLAPARFRRGERVHLVAISRTLNGRLAASGVRAFVPRR